MIAGSRPTQWIPYCGAAPDPDEIWSRWNFDPILLAGMIGVAVLLVSRSNIEPGRSRYLASAFLLLLTLFVSPFCALTSALFSARVVHHVLLTAVAAPLLVLTLPRARTVVPGPLLFWTVLQALVFWAWHSPSLYAAALSNDGLYWLMQLSLLGSAIGFWSALRSVSAPTAVAALLATMMQMGLLGAVIVFAAAPLYAPHFASAVRWGFDPLEDQQLGGLVMWAPAAGLYLGAALLIAARWFARESRTAQR